MLPINPRIIAVICSAFGVNESIVCMGVEGINHTFDEHYLQVRVGVGEPSSDDTAYRHVGRFIEREQGMY